MKAQAVSAPRRRVISRHKFLNLSHATYDLKLECGHFVPGTQRQAFSKTVACGKCAQSAERRGSD